MSLDHTRPHWSCWLGPFPYHVCFLPLLGSDLARLLKSGGEWWGGEVGWAGLQYCGGEGDGRASAPPHVNSTLCVAVWGYIVGRCTPRLLTFEACVRPDRGWIFPITAAIRAPRLVLYFPHCTALHRPAGCTIVYSVHTARHCHTLM